MACGFTSPRRERARAAHSAARCRPPAFGPAATPAPEAAGRRRTAAESSAGPRKAPTPRPAAEPRAGRDVVAAAPLGEQASRTGAANVRHQRHVGDIRSLLGRAPEPVSKLKRRKAHTELVLERLPETEISRQRQRRHQLRQSDAPRGVRPLHVTSLGSQSALARNRGRPMIQKSRRARPIGYQPAYRPS